MRLAIITDDGIVEDVLEDGDRIEEYDFDKPMVMFEVILKIQRAIIQVKQ